MLPLSGCSARSQQVAGHWSHVLYTQHAAGGEGVPQDGAGARGSSSVLHPPWWLYRARDLHPHTQPLDASSHLTSPLFRGLPKEPSSPNINTAACSEGSITWTKSPLFPLYSCRHKEAHAAGKGAAIPACHPDPSQGLRHSSTSSKL